MSSKSRLLEIAKVFLQLGILGFGGPAAHIAMMEREIVKKRQWISQQHFLDLMGATNLVPGPNSTEMTMHCGYERGGWKGLFVAGISFIFPAVILTGILAWAYQKYGQLPAVEPYLRGITPAVIAIIFMAAFKLGKKALKTTLLYIIGAITLGLAIYGINEIAALAIGGLLSVAVYYISQQKHHTALLPLLSITAAEGGTLDNLKIGWIFLKIGSILYGSGYVLFAFLESALVDNGWLTQQGLIDAVGAGQFTPGPVLSTATFIGWQLNC